MELTSYAHGYGQSAYHFVFVPKYRYKVLRYPFVKQKCKQFFRTVAEKYNFKIHVLEIQDDHIHLFTELHPSISVSKAIMLYKGITGFYMLKQFPYLRRYYRKHHFWSAGKFFRSVGNVTANGIENYISQSQGVVKPNVQAIKRRIVAKQKCIKAQKSLLGFVPNYYIPDSFRGRVVDFINPYEVGAETQRMDAELGSCISLSIFFLLLIILFLVSL